MIRLMLLFYFFGILIFLIISSIAVHQLLRYRLPGDMSKLAVLIYGGVSGFIVLISLLFILKLDWS